MQRLFLSISMQCFPVSRANTSGHLYLKLTWAEWKAVEDTSSSILHYSNASELSEFTLYFDWLLSISVWVYDYDEWGRHWALRNWWSKPSVRTKLLFTTMRKWKERSCFFSFFFSSTYISVLWEPEGLQVWIISKTQRTKSHNINILVCIISMDFYYDVLSKKWYSFYQNCLYIEQNWWRFNQFLVKQFVFTLNMKLCWNYVMWHNPSRSEDFWCLTCIYDKWNFWPMRFQWVGLFRRKPSNRQNLSLIGGYSWLDLHGFYLRSYCFITSRLSWTQFYIRLALCIIFFLMCNTEQITQMSVIIKVNTASNLKWYMRAAIKPRITSKNNGGLM